MAGTNPQHRVLVIGAGSIGERHIRCFLATDRCKVSFVEINETLRQAVETRYSACGFATLEEGASESPEIAVVATPAHLHVEMATRLAEAGIHLLIEKPLSTGEAGIERLLALVRAQDLVAGVAYVYRSHPALADMRRMILKGSFGPPVQIVVVAGQHFPTYRPAYQQIYYRDRATGGGAIQDALTHLINAGEWLVGPVTRLVADAAHQVLSGVEVEDTVHILTRHGTVLGSYSLNQHQAPNETTITVICERGTLRFDAQKHQWCWMLRPGDSWEEGSSWHMERDELFTRQATDCLLAVLRLKPPTCSLADGLQTLRVNLAALRSVETGTWQTISAEESQQ
ncbi:MAG: Gfo/Idh/MocA family protein [Pirellulaceae bacterium]